MRNTGSLWPATAALAMCLGLLMLAGPVRSYAADKTDKDDETEGAKKKIVRVYEIGDEDDAGDDAEEAAKSGYLGVQVQDLTRRLKRAMDLEGVDGALVNRVEDDSPAEKAGIEKGDVIVQVGRNDIADAADLTRTVRGMKPDEKTSVVIVRDGDRRTLTVVLGARPKMESMRFEMPDGRAFRWESEGGLPPAGRMFLRHNEEMQEELEQLRQEISQLRDEIRQLRQELKRSPSGTR